MSLTTTARHDRLLPKFSRIAIRWLAACGSRRRALQPRPDVRALCLQGISLITLEVRPPPCEAMAVVVCPATARRQPDEAAVKSPALRRLSIGCALGGWLLASMVSVRAQTASPASPAVAVPSTVKPRALLDRYCVTCHNDRLKTANLSLQGLDLATVDRADRDLGESDPQAACGRDAAARCAASAARRL